MHMVWLAQREFPFRRTQDSQWHMLTCAILHKHVQVMKVTRLLRVDVKMENFLSAKTAEYTSEFCRTWLGCVYNPCHLCHFHCLQEEDDMGNPIGSAVECLAAQDDKPDPESLKATLRKLHNNLGHPSNRDLVRVLKNAGGTPAAIRAAEQFTCEICIQRQRPTPCLPTSAHQILDFNHRVGIDVKQVPGWLPNQQVKCLNIVDWASSFQVMCPFFEVETGPLIKKLFQEKWQSWAGSPVEVLMDPARTKSLSGFLRPVGTFRISSVEHSS